MAVLESPTKQRHAADLMTREVVTCYADATLDEAARTMREKDLGFLVVVRRGEHRPLGVLTDRDVCMAAYTQGRRLAEIPVPTAMSSPVRVAREGAGTDEVLGLMSDKKIRRVPVVDDKGDLKGVVGLADLARDAASNAAVRKLAETLRQVTHLKMI